MAQFSLVCLGQISFSNCYLNKLSGSRIFHVLLAEKWSVGWSCTSRYLFCDVQCLLVCMGTQNCAILCHLQEEGTGFCGIFSNHPPSKSLRFLTPVPHPKEHYDRANKMKQLYLKHQTQRKKLFEKIKNEEKKILSSWIMSWPCLQPELCDN